MQALAHLTFPRAVGQEQADCHFANWIKLFQKHSGQTLGWVRADERQRNGRKHIHAIVVAASALQYDIAAKLWLDQVGGRSATAVIQGFRKDRNGAAYVLKRMAVDDARFPKNLDLFGTAHRPLLDARLRRTLRRIWSTQRTTRLD